MPSGSRSKVCIRYRTFCDLGTCHAIRSLVRVTLRFRILKPLAMATILAIPPSGPTPNAPRRGLGPGAPPLRCSGGVAMSRLALLLLSLRRAPAARVARLAVAKLTGIARHLLASTGIEWHGFVQIYRIVAGQKWVTKLVRVPLLTLNDQGLTCENGSGLDFVAYLAKQWPNGAPQLALQSRHGEHPQA